MMSLRVDHSNMDRSQKPRASNFDGNSCLRKRFAWRGQQNPWENRSKKAKEQSNSLNQIRYGNNKENNSRGIHPRADSWKLDTAVGIYRSENLTFCEHTDKFWKKLAKRIGILNKIKCYLPVDQRLLHYNSVIKPVITYVSVVWSRRSSKVDLTRKRLQKRIILDELFNELRCLPFYEKLSR